MTPEQLDKQSRAAVIAYLRDSSVRLEYRYKDNDQWIKSNDMFFNLDQRYFRIAQPKSWYRVAQVIDGAIIANGDWLKKDIHKGMTSSNG